jgi:hypothetical protein
MDSNIIGRHSTYVEPAFPTPRITFAAVCDLTSPAGATRPGSAGPTS